MQQELLEGKIYKCSFPEKKTSEFTGTYTGFISDQCTPHYWHTFENCSGPGNSTFNYIIDYKMSEWIFTEI